MLNNGRDASVLDVLRRHGKHPGFYAMRAAAAAAKKTQFAPGADDAAALKKLAKQAGEAAGQRRT